MDTQIGPHFFRQTIKLEIRISNAYKKNPILSKMWSQKTRFRDLVSKSKYADALSPYDETRNTKTILRYDFPKI